MHVAPVTSSESDNKRRARLREEGGVFGEAFRANLASVRYNYVI